MTWKMDASGNWTRSSGSGEKVSSENGSKPKQEDKQPKVVADKGNTSDTNKAIRQSTDNKTAKISYAEEGNFKVLGGFSIRKGGTIKIGKGVAKRWQGSWRILSTTHTIDSKGYFTEGTVGRVPYQPDSDKKDSKSGNSDNKSDKNVVSNTDAKTSTEPKVKGASGSSSSNNSNKGKWKMNSSGVWTKS